MLIVPRLYPALLRAGRITIFAEAWPRGRGAMVLPQRRGVERDRRAAQADALSALQGGRHADSPRLLYGFDESSPRRKTVRARRIFCSNRQARRGCGRTFSVWLADKIRRLSLTTGALWRFLQRAVAGSIVAAIRAADCHLSDRTWQRIWKRFDLGQSKIRTALSGRCPPPELPAERLATAGGAQVLAHLQAAFPDADCPIAAFQHTLRTFFV